MSDNRAAPNAGSTRNRSACSYPRMELGLVDVARAVAHRAALGAGEPRLRSLAERRRRRRGQGASAHAHLCVGAPRLRLREAPERLVDAPPIEGAVDLRAIAG